jgi:hypothetical protein
MGLFPVPLGGGSDGFTSRQLSRASHAQAETALHVHRHRLAARAAAEIDIAYSEAGGDAVAGAIEEELNVLQDGLARAGGSAAAQEIVARKVALLSAIDNRRIARRFG